MLAAFVAWHLKLGFSRIFLYFDDPDDAGIAFAKRLRREAKARGHGDALRIVPCNSQLKSEWRSLQTASRFGSDDISAVEHHVEVALLNCEHCLRKAHADGDIDWLLHIDGDELFFIDDLDAAAHFGPALVHSAYRSATNPRRLPRASRFLNVFESVTLFRRHTATLEKTILDAGGDKHLAASALAIGDTMAEGTTGSAQGKSACRVLPGALPLSVHAFAPPEPGMMSKCFAGFADTQDAIGENAVVVSPMGNPCILHYISCDFGFWWRKYELLGNFSLCKPGGAAVGGVVEADSFHAESRTLVDSGKADKAAARRVYERVSACSTRPRRSARSHRYFVRGSPRYGRPFRASRVSRGSSSICVYKLPKPK